MVKILAAPRESSASLGKGWARNVRDESSDLWRGMVSCKSQDHKNESQKLQNHKITKIN